MSDHQLMKHQWNQHGWIKCKNLIDPSTANALSDWVDIVSTEPGNDSHERLHYFEQTDLGVRLCRTERYVNDHQGLKALILKGPLIETAGLLMDEPAILYKEKVNYKQPGGAGFAPHQDATAYKYIDHHITCLVAVDPMTVENGCLEVASGQFTALLPDNGDGCLADGVLNEIVFEPVPMAPGDVLYFSSLIPHRSGPNTSENSRRALYLTYNGLSDGDRRAQYYADRDRQIARMKNDVTSRISTIGHFQGRAAQAPETTHETTHE